MMKKSLSLVLMLLLAGTGALAACSKPGSDVSADAEDSTALVDGESGDEMAADGSAPAADLTAPQQAYVDEVKTSLDAMEAEIEALQTQDTQPDKFPRLVNRYEDARATLATLETSGDNNWQDARKEMRRAMKRLDRVAEKVLGS